RVSHNSSGHWNGPARQQPRRYRQLRRLRHARCVAGAAARVGKSFARLLCCPAPTYQHTRIAGPHPAGWAQLPTVPVAHFRVNGVAEAAYAIGVHRAAPRRQSGGTLGAPNATLLDPGTFGKAGSSNPKGYYMLFAVKNDGVSALKTQ